MKIISKLCKTIHYMSYKGKPTLKTFQVDV